MELEGETIVEGPSVDRLIGLQKAVRPEDWPHSGAGVQATVQCA